MGLRDLSETWGWIQRIVRRLERIESGAILERSSITDGVMTFIRGTLRLLNGARLELEGILDIVGQVFLRGPMTVSGPNAAITVGGVVITPLGGGRVQIGPNIVLDAATQTITVGGADGIVINATEQTITVGDDVVLDASDGGRVEVGGPEGVVIDTSSGRPRVLIGSGGELVVDAPNPLILSPDGTQAVSWESGAYLLSNDGGVGMGANGFGAAVQAVLDGSAALYYPSGQVAVWTSADGVRFYSPDGTQVMQLNNSGLVGP